jgi:hypothetical protein
MKTFYTRTFIARLAVALSDRIEELKMQGQRIAVALPAGLVATAVMTVVMLLTPLAGLPAINMPRVLGWAVGMPLSVGVVLDFIVGVVIAAMYALFFTRRFSGAGWMNGLVFGFGLWLVLMVIAGPLMGWGLFAFSTASPFGTMLTCLLGTLPYGCTLGFAHEIAARRDRPVRSVTEDEVYSNDFSGPQYS